MAIHDLLWACPVCGREGGLKKGRGGERCAGCGTLFRRGAGATIEAVRADGEVVARPACAWSDHLPEIGEPARIEGRGGVLHRERVLARFAEACAPVRHRGVYLNSIERFGARRPGTLSLHPDRLALTEEGGGEHLWPFDTLSAVQASSSTLQISARGRALVSFRFPEGSARFWEELLSAVLRRFYRATGRGEIVELQPRIVTR